MSYYSLDQVEELLNAIQDVFDVRKLKGNSPHKLEAFNRLALKLYDFKRQLASLPPSSGQVVYVPVSEAEFQKVRLDPSVPKIEWRETAKGWLKPVTLPEQRDAEFEETKAINKAYAEKIERQSRIIQEQADHIAAVEFNCNQYSEQLNDQRDADAVETIDIIFEHRAMIKALSEYTGLPTYSNPKDLIAALTKTRKDDAPAAPAEKDGEILKTNNMILDTFDIIGNDDREQWEFTPKVDGYTSYTVSYSVSNNKADACIIVWKAISAQREREAASLNPVSPDRRG